MRFYLLAALGAAIAGLCLYVAYLRSDMAALEAENASLSRSVAVLEGQVRQSKEAERVARAEAQEQAERAEEYDRLRETLLDGGEDADLPNWFRDYLAALLGSGGLRSAD